MITATYIGGAIVYVLIGYILGRKVRWRTDQAVWERAYRQGYATGRSDQDYFPPEMIYRGNRVE